MDITLIEPFHTGSHAAWAQGYTHYSRHRVDILSLSGHHWKWRMHGGAVTLARKFMQSKARPDLLLATDMLDLTTFLALTRSRTAQVPTIFYFHENQISYPKSPRDRDTHQHRDHHYGFINFSSALAADKVLFNSRYHLNAFFTDLPRFLKRFPPPNELGAIEAIREKSHVLPLGLDLQKFDSFKHLKRKTSGQDQTPLILWNHRWEYDKNPDDFFHALFVLDGQGLDFKVAVLGEDFHHSCPIFDTARQKLGDRLVHFGYVDDFETYAHWLYMADILPVTSYQDFFGVSIAEALYCGCYPILPKRLAFPELVPYAQCRDNYYLDFQQLVDKLVEAIRNIKVIRQKQYCQYIEPYDWRDMAVRYDNLFMK